MECSVMIESFDRKRGSFPHPCRFIIEAFHSYACTVVGCYLLCLGSCLARGVVLQLFVQNYHWLLQHFGTCITNAYSTHFVKSSGLNAKAKFHCAKRTTLSHNRYKNVFLYQ